MSCPGPNRLTMTMKALSRPSLCSLFFFNDTATTEIYTLSLHDALPICRLVRQAMAQAHPFQERRRPFGAGLAAGERHSQQHVLQGRKTGQQVERLKDIANVVGPETVASGLRELRQVATVDLDHAARIGPA